MHYRPLGRTGIQVSTFCLGAMMFGKVGNPDHGECIRMIHTALDAGINYIDTADVYSQGESEEIIGKALKGRRDDVIVGSKVSLPMGTDPNRRGGSRRWITRAVEDSLRRLQTDYLDLYQLHRPAPDTDIEETLAVMDDLARAGKIRVAGTSTFPAVEIVEAQWTAERRGLARFRVEQQPYSILNRQIEREVLPACQRHGMGVTAWSPLAKGLLTGKHRIGQPSGDSLRSKYFPELMSDRASLERVDRLASLAREAGLPLTHMALAFVTAHPGIASAIIGPRNPDQLEDLLGAFGTVLDDEVLDRIDAIVAPGTDVAPLGASAYTPPEIIHATLRRRPARARGAA